MNIGGIAIGSNSTRLLTRLENGLEDRAREDTKLFSGLNEEGNLSDEAMDRTVRAVLRLKKRAIQFGAEYIMLLATSATRDAGNSEEFSRRLLAGTGLRLRVITGNKEAELAFRAASAGRHCAVLDIGGGSAEISYGAEGKIIKSVSAQEGANRLLREGEIFSAREAEGVYARVIARLRHAYENVYTADVRGSTNRELYASDDAGIMDTFRSGIANVKDEKLRNFLGKITEEIHPYEAGKLILTDDKAPVEVLGMQVIDELIQAELGYYKAIYEEKGLRGLIDSF